MIFTMFFEYFSCTFAGETCKVEVKEAPQGVTPPTQNSSKKPGHQPNKARHISLGILTKYIL